MSFRAESGLASFSWSELRRFNVARLPFEVVLIASAGGMPRPPAAPAGPEFQSRLCEVGNVPINLGSDLLRPPIQNRTKPTEDLCTHNVQRHVYSYLMMSVEWEVEGEGILDAATIHRSPLDLEPGNLSCDSSCTVTPCWGSIVHSSATSQ